MALLKFGLSECKLCNGIIQKEDELVVFPAFIPQGHKLQPYSDAAFHKSCFLNWVQHDEFQELFEVYKQVWDNRPKNLSFEEMQLWGKSAFKDIFD